MRFLIRLKDQNGQFWLQSERLWSEDMSYAVSFTDLDKAEAVASIARYRAKNCADWFPKIQVVSFPAYTCQNYADV